MPIKMATSISLWERYYLRPMTNRDITRLNLYHELLANRYLLSIVLTNLMNTNKYLEVLSDVVFKKERKKEQKEKGSHTLLKERKEKKKERTIAQSEKSLRNIEFNSFTLSPNKFDALLREYDHDVVTDACVVLDKLIGIQGKTYKDIPRKLEELCKQFSLREKLVETLDASTRTIRQVPVEQIEDETMAKKYIFATPSYLRNIDKGCKYLAEKFAINLEGIRGLG